MLKNAIRTRPTDERARKLRDRIAQALHTNFLTPDAASKLRGRIGPPTSLLMGKLCRGMMGPLIRRQYGSKACLLTSGLKRNLLWWNNAIWTLHPRSIPLTLFPPMGADSDAQGHGHVATRALLPAGETVPTRLPQWFIEMASAAEAGPPIYLFEQAETVLTACLAAYRSDGNPRTCVLRIDNKAALDALVKGSSFSALGTVLANLFRSGASRCPIVWRFEYANTKSNAEDPPSRLCDTPVGLTCSRSSDEIPPEFARIFAPCGVLRRESTLANK